MNPDDKPRRALVVEDELAIRELLRLHLQLAGFELDEVGNGRVALDRAREKPFDVILLDVMLPGLDGVTLCGAIRAAGPNKATPILMLTARDTESDKVMGLESGADDYMTKACSLANACSSRQPSPCAARTPSRRACRDRTRRRRTRAQRPTA